MTSSSNTFHILVTTALQLLLVVIILKVERGPFKDGMHDGMEVLALWNKEQELVDLVYCLQHRSVILLLYLFEIGIVLIVQYITLNYFQPFEKERAQQCLFQQFNAMEKKSSELVIEAHDLEQQQRVSINKYASGSEPPYLASIKLIFLTFAVCFPIVFLEVSSGLCDSIAELRRRIQTVGADHVLFLDEVPFKVNEAPSHTIVAPGETAYIEVEDNSSYAARFDMIACCASTQVLPSIIFSPEDRAALGQSGINHKMLIKYIQDILAQACGALDRYPLYLVLDRASIHNEEKILEAFHDNGCQELVDVWKMPTKAAKRMSPLDNALFHHWKERIRNGKQITKNNIVTRMADEWNNLPSSLIRSQYRHCGLLRWHDLYFDCPQPAVHQHSS
jgi:hypothetical protein